LRAVRHRIFSLSYAQTFHNGHPLSPPAAFPAGSDRDGKKMGQAMSSEPVPDLVGAEFMAACWGIAFYGIGMIWCAATLTDRWMGGRCGPAHTDFGSWIWALILSTAWPLVFAALAMSRSKP